MIKMGTKAKQMHDNYAKPEWPELIVFITILEFATHIFVSLLRAEIKPSLEIVHYF